MSKQETTSSLYVRWGIVGCSKIASDFCYALKACDGHKLSAVASRNIERASIFAAKLAIPKFYGSYENLLADNEVDVVYVGNDTRDHFELAMKTLQANKALLCEKPFCMSWQQCSLLVQTAKQNHKLLVEGLWSLFFPSYDHLRRAINTGEIGEVQELYILMKFSFGPEIQIRNKKLGGGVSMGFGIYGLHLAALLFEGFPHVKAEALLDDDGLDIKSKIFLKFENNKKANIDLSVQDEQNCVAVIKGSKGVITLKEFFACQEIVVNNVTYSYPVDQSPESASYYYTMGFVHEISRVGEAWKKGLLQVGEVPWENCLRVYKIMDEVLRQINVTYPFPLDGSF